MSIETIRLSEKEKQQLITLKRRTGIHHWNILCRWAFCMSLREPSQPPYEQLPSDSTVEMSWKVFSGSHEALYLGLLRQHAHMHAPKGHSYSELQLARLHINRGLSYLTTHCSSLNRLFNNV